MCVAILNTSQLEQTLACGCGDETGTTGCRNEATHDGADLTADLGGNGVRLTKSSTPITSPDGDNRELSEDDSSTDGGRYFLGALDTETDVTVKVTDRDERLETRTLTGAGLLLDGHDLHDLILELGEEEVHDLELLDGEREEVDLLHGLDLAILYETTQLGDGNPWVTVQFCRNKHRAGERTIPSPHPCDRRGVVPYDHVPCLHVHVQSHHVRVQRQPL